MKIMKCVTGKFQRLIEQMKELLVCVDFEVFVDDPAWDETDYIHKTHSS